jgi:hypothetical protein
MAEFERVFPEDRMTKRERVEATLRHEPVDRAALLEQMAYNPGVIGHYTGRAIEGFDYTCADVFAVIRQTMDLVMPPREPRGTNRYTNDDGAVYQNDNWTTWRVTRPFEDVAQVKAWFEKGVRFMEENPVDPSAALAAYRERVDWLRAGLGETMALDFSSYGFCAAYDYPGLDLFTYFQIEHEDLLARWLDLRAGREVARIHAVAEAHPWPVILIPEDFGTKQGPIFSPDFLARHHFPHVAQLAAAWHEHGVHVLYHSDGNYHSALPGLIDAGVDGFYCLERNCGMDAVELKRTYPDKVWAGGIDGVDLMERGTPDEVRAEVRRHIEEGRVLETGGMFIATSSEVNPTIPVANFVAMVETVGSLRNPAAAGG